MADHYADGTYLWWHLSRPSPELTAALADGWLAAQGCGERVLLAGRSTGVGTSADAVVSAATPALTWPACRRDGIHKRYAVEVYSTV